MPARRGTSLVLGGDARGLGGGLVAEPQACLEPDRRESSLRDILSPLLFGLVLLALWEIACVGGGIPFVLMPPPSAILAKLATSAAILAPDFVQTVVKSALPGWVIGGLSGFAVALVCDRSPFLRRGLLPIGDFASALPIIGIAPIMVMWFGFDWHRRPPSSWSMTFFPMLVNTLAGPGRCRRAWSAT